MSDYLNQISLLTDQDELQSEDPHVTLATVHAAKGLEFNNVFIVGLEENLLPSAIAIESKSLSEIEEERRLLYVAITRAKHFCMMSYASSRFRNGQTCQPSRFLRDIDTRYLLLSGGTNLQNSPMFNPVQSYRDSFHSAPYQRKPERSGGTLSNQYGLTIGSGVASPKPSGQNTTPAASQTGGFGLHTPEELNAGMKIVHERFGAGTILEVDTSASNARIVVQFKNLDTKTLLLKFAKFKIIN